MTDFSNALSVAASGLRTQAQRLTHVSENIANADTPGFVGRDLPSFQDIFAPSEGSPSMQRATRPGHLHGATASGIDGLIREDHSFSAPDGNTVSIETEMLRATAAKRQHDRSLAIYKSAMNIVRSSLGRQ